ncbi:putative branched-chain-amino-acid ABC-transporter ATP-binding component [Octadecabacter arcticus 238]|jgi:branched-chain amino acid transport system ATP-binding protein|uniref:Putative branched-chain-amino-acid ABC-transporter ATP-binding component n=1 Tax=Octadecabacter arcticus 238 TaxID=391616 RepID=M9RKX2_9RHOB|nr:ABC transporter ATP-binding protein [Octadecabacter arcticus]AGI71046.1 putative branched-chain-amino-acid ABC-transporter ATP-binding component [Octadecabacter arcticus 238]
MKLDVSGLHSGYGKVTILHGLNFVAEAGEITCVLGPNGAGKSTLMKTIAGHLPVDRGDIALDGVSIAKLNALQTTRTGIAYVPQEQNTFVEMTVRDNLLASALSFSDTGARIDNTYERFPILKERSNQLASTLSGGERQTLAVANALIGAPKLLILDEPTAGLAPIFVDRIVDWICELAESGITVIWVVEQNPEKILKISRTTWMIDAGRNRETLPSADLLQPGRLEEMLLQSH